MIVVLIGVQDSNIAAFVAVVYRRPNKNMH